MTNERFPVAPLLERAVASLIVTSVKGFQQRVKVAGHHYLAYERDGLPYDTADRWAVRLGFHPGEIWDGWWSPQPEYCRNGHERTEENTYYERESRRPHCRPCNTGQKRRALAARARKAAA